MTEVSDSVVNFFGLIDMITGIGEKSDTARNECLMVDTREKLLTDLGIPYDNETQLGYYAHNYSQGLLDKLIEQITDLSIKTLTQQPFTGSIDPKLEFPEWTHSVTTTKLYSLLVDLAHSPQAADAMRTQARGFQESAQRQAFIMALLSKVERFDFDFAPDSRKVAQRTFLDASAINAIAQQIREGQPAPEAPNHFEEPPALAALFDPLDATDKSLIESTTKITKSFHNTYQFSC